MVELAGMLAVAMVWDTFWSWSRSTVAEPPCGVMVTSFVVTRLFWPCSVMMRSIAEYVRLSEVVPVGTTGGSVSWTRSSACKPDCVELDVG